MWNGAVVSIVVLLAVAIVVLATVIARDYLAWRQFPDDENDVLSKGIQK